MPLLRTYSRTPLLTFILLAISALTLTAACQSAAKHRPTEGGDAPEPAIELDPALLDTATFAGGCFWCMEPPYDEIEGVKATISGFAGGEKPDPTYREVASGATQYAEVVQVIYDSAEVDYERLLGVYWHNVDPLDARGQFCDRGMQYRPAIFYHNAHQRRLAEASKERLKASGRFSEPIVVNITALDGSFYAAEAYHQNFYKKNPDRYYSYRRGCRRDARLQELWGT